MRKRCTSMIDSNTDKPGLTHERPSSLIIKSHVIESHKNSGGVARWCGRTGQPPAGGGGGGTFTTSSNFFNAIHLRVEPKWIVAHLHDAALASAVNRYDIVNPDTTYQMWRDLFLQFVCVHLLSQWL